MFSFSFKELSRLQQWIDDDPRLFTTDILLSLLLSYRDIQAYNNMVELVEKLPTHDQVITLYQSLLVRFYFRYYLRSVTGVEHWVRVRVRVMVVPKVKPTRVSSYKHNCIIIINEYMYY